MSPLSHQPTSGALAHLTALSRKQLIQSIVLEGASQHDFVLHSIGPTADSRGLNYLRTRQSANRVNLDPVRVVLGSTTERSRQRPYPIRLHRGDLPGVFRTS
jgi:hypothetical protein